MKLSGSAHLPTISIDRSDKEAIYQQIHKAFTRAIRDGILRPGQRVPSTRVLAAELGVSRFPLLTAYAQLHAEGYFEGKVGSGTIVSQHALEQAFEKPSPATTNSDRQDRRAPYRWRAAIPALAPRPPWLRGLGAFGVGQIAFDQFPAKAWADLTARCCRRLSADSLHYGDLNGSPRLRLAVAEYLRTSRAVRCDAEQIMIVNGSQQGLDLCIRALLGTESSVWVEDPGYVLGRAAFILNGCRIIPVPVDAEGLQVDEGIARDDKAHAVLLTPSHQFPLGATMSRARRQQLLQWAGRTGAWVIEDDYDSEFRFDGAPIGALQGMDHGDRVLYIGTLSKVLFPSIRVGFVVVPPDLVDHFSAVRRVMDLGPARFVQEVLADFIEQGHFARHIRKMRTLYRERRSILAGALEKTLKSHLEVVGSEAGLHLTVLLSQRTDDVAIATRAAADQLWLWPLSTHYPGPPQRAGFILGFGNCSPAEIMRSVRKLGYLLSESQSEVSRAETKPHAWSSSQDLNGYCANTDCQGR